MEEYVEWKDAYEHLKCGGKAQHELWHPNCYIKLNEFGEIVFEDGTECWLSLDELVSKGWIILPSGNVWETFEDFPDLAKTLTINLVTTKLWHEKGKLHRNLYDFYHKRGSLSILEGGWCVIHREECGFIVDLSTTFNPLTIYSSNYQDAKESIEKFSFNFKRVVELEKKLSKVQTGALDSKELQTIYLEAKEMI